MKLFNLFTRKFEQEPTAIEAIETWVVEWPSIIKNIIGDGIMQPNMQCFTSKLVAEAFASELISARKLLGDNGYSAKVYKQEVFSN
ncbi:MAG: hypothetical protein GY799_33175 [Desulfobulbaceae bacterium]|nr:hypothetical protein [Desulfobulbaceae bacterium]